MYSAFQNVAALHFTACLAVKHEERNAPHVHRVEQDRQVVVCLPVRFVPVLLAVLHTNAICIPEASTTAPEANDIVAGRISETLPSLSTSLRRQHGCTNAPTSERPSGPRYVSYPITPSHSSGQCMYGSEFRWQILSTGRSEAWHGIMPALDSEAAIQVGGGYEESTHSSRDVQQAQLATGLRR